MIDHPEVDFAVAAVREASLLAREVQRSMISPGLTKDDRSPVTVADFAAQALIAYRLSESFPEGTRPDAGLVGEENADALREGEGQSLLAQITQHVQSRIPHATGELVLEWIDRGAGEPPSSFWTLDPIDGTKGFLRGDQYAVALAKIDNGRVEIGALGCPELTTAEGTSGTVAIARRGHGAHWTPLEGVGLEGQGEWLPLTVSECADIAEARLLRSVESAHTNTGAIGQLIAALGITAPAVPLDSQAKYAVLAAGAGDALLRLLSSSQPDYREKIWDQAAGSIVVEEAGGKVTDLDGKPLDFSHGRTLATNRGVLASNGHLHDALLAGLQQIRA